ADNSAKASAVIAAICNRIRTGFSGPSKLELSLVVAFAKAEAENYARDRSAHYSGKSSKGELEEPQCFPRRGQLHHGMVMRRSTGSDFGSGKVEENASADVS
ncbi:MAG: hypothetical protein WBL40_08390, partial [Terrimicrobiaceae bacterium]